MVLGGGGWGVGNTWAAWPYLTAGRGHGAVAGPRGVAGPGLRARALALALVLTVPIPWAKKAGGRSQGGQDRSQEGQGSDRGGGGGEVAVGVFLPPRVPSQLVPGQSARLVGPVLGRRPSRRGGGGSPDTPLAAPRARDSRSAAAARSHAIPPPPHTGVGPLPPRGAQGHHLAAGRPLRLWAYGHPSAALRVRFPSPSQGEAHQCRVRRRHHHHYQPWAQPAGCQGVGLGRPHTKIYLELCMKFPTLFLAASTKQRNLPPQKRPSLL